jgi:Catalase
LGESSAGRRYGLPMITPEQAVDAVNERFGRHPGYRALHAKGILCKGTFRATPEAASLTRAAHMQGGSAAVTVRLSNGSGDPRSPDYAPDVRGLATKFYLPDGSRTDIVAQTAPRFPARTPEGFIEFVRAMERGALAVVEAPSLPGKASGGLAGTAGERRNAQAAGQLCDLPVLRHPRFSVDRSRWR